MLLSLSLPSIHCGRAFGTPEQGADAQSIPPAEAAPPSSWLDPRAVAALTRDCRFNPEALKGDERRAWLGDEEPEVGSPLSCTATLEQSCRYDPCYDKQETCTTACNQGCGRCAERCAAGCETCKAACHDDECRAACAQRCGACRQTCVRQHDRCTTGGCAPHFLRCHKDLKAAWRANRCAKACVPYVACLHRCEGAPCAQRCEEMAVKGCDRSLCPGQGNMALDPDSL